MKFAMFFFAEYIAIVTSPAVMVSLFLGGWHLPFLQHEGIRSRHSAVSLYWQLPCRRSSCARSAWARSSSNSAALLAATSRALDGSPLPL